MYNDFLTEPYFENLIDMNSSIQYPFECHVHDAHLGYVLAAAHWHYAIEILYMVEGDARAVLGGVEYAFRTGDMVLINGREVHAVYGEPSKVIRYIVLKFDPALLYTTDRSLFESKYVLPFTMAVSNNQKVFAASELNESPVPALIKGILNEFIKKPYGFELALRTDIGRIFLWIIRNWNAKGIQLDVKTALKNADIKRFQKVFDFLDTNYMNEITVKTIATMLNMSYSYFSRSFKALIGKTFSEYLSYVRITEAERLLLTTNMSVTEVALETGYSNSSYFIQQFKDLKGTSPKQFRKTALNEALL